MEANCQTQLSDVQRASAKSSGSLCDNNHHQFNAHGPQSHRECCNNHHFLSGWDAQRLSASGHHTSSIKRRPGLKSTSPGRRKAICRPRQPRRYSANRGRESKRKSIANRPRTNPSKPEKTARTKSRRYRLPCIVDQAEGILFQVKSCLVRTDVHKEDDY
jgi:hypothetical protein